MPSSQKILKIMGENFKLARLRRRLSAEQVCERADISRSTLWQVEKGSPSVAMGIYCKVLFVLNLDKDLLKLAEDDVLAGVVIRHHQYHRSIGTRQRGRTTLNVLPHFQGQTTRRRQPHAHGPQNHKSTYSLNLDFKISQKIGIF
jgi:transcriptional regulator with XRE-family HTH domain